METSGICWLFAKDLDIILWNHIVKEGRSCLMVYLSPPAIPASYMTSILWKHSQYSVLHSLDTRFCRSPLIISRPSPPVTRRSRLLLSFSYSLDARISIRESTGHVWFSSSPVAKQYSSFLDLRLQPYISINSEFFIKHPRTQGA
jgi:hypothetical protein